MGRFAPAIRLSPYMGLTAVRIGSPAPRDLYREGSAWARVYMLAPRIDPWSAVRLCRTLRSFCAALCAALTRWGADGARVQGRRRIERASFKRRPPAVRLLPASSLTTSVSDSSSSTPLGGLTVLPSSSSSSGS